MKKHTDTDGPTHAMAMARAILLQKQVLAIFEEPSEKGERRSPFYSVSRLSNELLRRYGTSYTSEEITPYVDQNGYWLAWKQLASMAGREGK